MRRIQAASPATPAVSRPAVKPALVNNKQPPRSRSLLEIASQGARSLLFQRKVRFCRYDKVDQIPSVRDLPKEMVRTLYYSKLDMKRITAERRKAVQWLAKNQHHQDQEWGLETPQVGAMKTQLAHESIMSVLVEQEMQWEEREGDNNYANAALDDTMIAEVYFETTFASQLEAHQRALRAQVEVQKYLLSTTNRWTCYHHHSTKNSSAKARRPSIKNCNHNNNNNNNLPVIGLQKPQRQTSLDSTASSISTSSDDSHHKTLPKRAFSEATLSIAMPMRIPIRYVSDSEASSGEDSDSSSVATPTTVSKRPIQMPVRQTSDPKLHIPPDSPQPTRRRVEDLNKMPERRATNIQFNSSISLPPTSGGLSSWVRV